MTSKSRLLNSIIIVSILMGSVWGSSSAFFSDLEMSSGNIMQAGGFDLLLNGSNDTEALVYLDDLKPGDNFMATKSAILKTNPGRVWMHLKDLEDGQGQQSEPENLEEATDGTRSDIQNFMWYDLKVGDEVLISLDDEVLLPEVVSCWIPLGTFPGNEAVNIEQSFHFWDSVTNWAQGDILTFSEEFWAVQDRNNDVGPPERDRIWNSETKKCEDAEPILLETFQVDANNSFEEVSTTITESGKEYLIKAIGTASAGDTIEFDAQYSITNKIPGDTWTDLVSGYESYGADLLELSVNGSFVDWDAYNLAHEYEYTLAGDGNPISFYIYDVYYPNNTGSLTVEIYEMP